MNWNLTLFEMLSVVPLCQASLKFGTSGTYVYVLSRYTLQQWCSLIVSLAAVLVQVADGLCNFTVMNHM